MVNLLCKLDKISVVLDSLGLSYSNAGKITLSSYEFVVNHNLNFYFTRCDNSTIARFDVLQISKDLIWKLDKFQNCLLFTKKSIQIEGNKYLLYLCREGTAEKPSSAPLQEIANYSSDDLQLKMCDIYLLLPGKIDSKKNVFDTFNEHHHELFTTFKARIDQAINGEYYGNLFKNMTRNCLGEITIKIKCFHDNKVYFQKGLLCYVKHPLGFCILEMFIPCCSIGGNKLLNYYCGEMLEIEWGNGYYTIDALFTKLGIRRYGKKRSLVFSYGELSEKERINALANEEFPMGQIDGNFFKTLSRKNIAHYNTAQVFVSSETVLEVCSYINIFPEDRISYHVIEIFFVEMILFQDASIDKVYLDLQHLSNNLDMDVNLAIQKSNEINYEMTQVIKFSDYGCFLFPTVRQSAQTIADAFDVEYIFEKYENNKKLIDILIKSNAQKAQERQERIQNRYLFLITILSTVGVLGEIIHFFFEDASVSAYSYLSASIIVGVFYLLYLLRIRINKK